MQACHNIWGHLITNNEWMSIARDIEKINENWSWKSVWSGLLYNGNVSWSDFWIPAWDDKNELLKTETTPSDNRRALKLSNGEVIWDLSGNVREHVNGRNTTNGQNFNTMNANVCGASWSSEWNWYSFYNNDWEMPCNYMNGYNYTSIWPKTPFLNAGNAIGRIYSYKSNSITTDKILLRGGDAGFTAVAGVYTISLFRTSSNLDHFVGFRCAY